MGKKEFKSGLDAIFQGSTLDEPIETKGKETLVSGSPRGIRATFIVDADALFKLKAIAYWERKQIKDIVDRAFNNLISNYPKEKIDEILKLYNENLG